MTLAETISSLDIEGSPASAEEKESFVSRPIEEIEKLFHQKQHHILTEDYDDLHKDFCRSIFQNRQSFVGTGFQLVLAHRAGFAPLYELRVFNCLTSITDAIALNPYMKLRRHKWKNLPSTVDRR